MVRSRIASALATLAFLAALVASLVLLAPSPVSAGPVFSAGDFDSGICSCPVSYGDCVCKIGT